MNATFDELLVTDLAEATTRGRLGMEGPASTSPVLLADFTLGEHSYTVAAAGCPAQVTATVDGQPRVLLEGLRPARRGLGPINPDWSDEGVPVQLDGTAGRVTWVREGKRSTVAGSLRFYRVESARGSWCLCFDTGVLAGKWLALSRGAVPCPDVVVRIAPSGPVTLTEPPPEDSPRSEGARGGASTHGRAMLASARSLARRPQPAGGRPSDAQQLRWRADADPIEIALAETLYLGTQTFMLSMRAERTAIFLGRHLGDGTGVG